MIMPGIMATAMAGATTPPVMEETQVALPDRGYRNYVTIGDSLGAINTVPNVTHNLVSHSETVVAIGGTALPNWNFQVPSPGTPFPQIDVVLEGSVRLGGLVVKFNPGNDNPGIPIWTRQVNALLTRLDSIAVPVSASSGALIRDTTDETTIIGYDAAPGTKIVHHATVDGQEYVWLRITGTPPSSGDTLTVTQADASTFSCTLAQDPASIALVQCIYDYYPMSPVNQTGTTVRPNSWEQYQLLIETPDFFVPVHMDVTVTKRGRLFAAGPTPAEWYVNPDLSNDNLHPNGDGNDVMDLEFAREFEEIIATDWPLTTNVPTLVENARPGMVILGESLPHWKNDGANGLDGIWSFSAFPDNGTFAWDGTVDLGGETHDVAKITVNKASAHGGTGSKLQHPGNLLVGSNYTAVTDLYQVSFWARIVPGNTLPEDGGLSALELKLSWNDGTFRNSTYRRGFDHSMTEWRLIKTQKRVIGSVGSTFSGFSAKVTLLGSAGQPIDLTAYLAGFSIAALPPEEPMRTLG